VPTLIVIGYQDEATAAVAGEELVRLSVHLDVPPEDVAVVAVNAGGLYRATTRMSDSGRPGGTAFWLPLLGVLVLEPPGTPGSAAMRAVVEEAVGVSIAPRFAGEVRGLLAPGASALFVLVREGDVDVVLDALGRYGGRQLKASWG